MAGTVLLIEDEQSIANVVRMTLERDGYRVICVRNRRGGSCRVRGATPVSLVLLDIGLPGIDGLEVCRSLRARSELPIIMLTARDEEADRVVGLELGADDYVSKPFSPRELAARVKAVLRRSTAAPRAEELALGDVTLSRPRHEVQVGGRPVELTATEFELLAFFMENPGLLFSREVLLDRVWGLELSGRHAHRGPARRPGAHQARPAASGSRRCAAPATRRRGDESSPGEGQAGQGPRGIPSRPLRSSFLLAVTFLGDCALCRSPSSCGSAICRHRSHQLAHQRCPGLGANGDLPCPCRPLSFAVCSSPWWLSPRSSGCGQWWSHRQSSSEQRLTPVRSSTCRAGISPTQASPPSADPTRKRRLTCASTAQVCGSTRPRYRAHQACHRCVAQPTCRRGARYIFERGTRAWRAKSVLPPSLWAAYPGSAHGAGMIEMPSYSFPVRILPPRLARTRWLGKYIKEHGWKAGWATRFIRSRESRVCRLAHNGPAALGRQPIPANRTPGTLTSWVGPSDAHPPLHGVGGSCRCRRPGI